MQEQSARPRPCRDDTAHRRTGASPVEEADVLERTVGRSGELTLRRSGADLEIILNGTFLISTANAASSVALITAALPFLGGAPGIHRAEHASRQAERGSLPPSRRPHQRRLGVLIGGLGLGLSLDAALAEPGVESVTVVEYEPVIVDWFRTHGGDRAARFAEAELAGRARILVGDVADVMRDSPGAFDLVVLDTDNGPDWLVREGNAALYAEAGLALAHDALRPSGVAAFWSPERYDWFATRLAATFFRVDEVLAHDHIGNRRHEYVMYVGQRA